MKEAYISSGHYSKIASELLCANENISLRGVMIRKELTFNSAFFRLWEISESLEFEILNVFVSELTLLRGQVAGTKAAETFMALKEVWCD